jgi:hypothetical protein
VIPFLKFCFSSTVSEATGSSLFLPNTFNHQIYLYFLWLDLVCSDKSWSEALILASINPKCEYRLFAELWVQYKKTTSLCASNCCELWVNWCKNEYIHLTKGKLYFSWLRSLTIIFLCITGGAKGGSKEPQSPAKKYSSLRKKCVEATAILFCGLNAVKASYLDISKLQEGCLNQGLLKPQHFIGKIIYFYKLMPCWLKKAQKFLEPSDLTKLFGKD